MKQVIAIAARRGLIVETGHSAPAEGLAIVRECRRQGVTRIVVTHAMLAPVRMTIAQMQQAAQDGAYLEFVYNGLTGPNREYTAADYARAIRAIGPASCILAIDLGQPANPLHPDGLTAFFAALEKDGITPAEIGRMSKTNPESLVGLE